MKALLSFAYPAVALSLMGCVSQTYAYAPTAAAPTLEGGSPAAVYSVPPPPEQAKGSVQVLVTGFGRLGLDTGSSVPSLRVRVVIVNVADTQPWAMDARQVVATVEGQGESQPAFVNTDLGTPPILTVSPGNQGIVDLYYPLASGIDTSAPVPALILSWQLSAGRVPVAAQTPFSSVERSPDACASGSGAPSSKHPCCCDFPAAWYRGGSAPHWWYNPSYLKNSFDHHAVFVAPQGRFIATPFPVHPHTT